MLQAVNIPSSPLPEAPSAPPDASGDAGERAEFAQLLQQANAVDGAGAHDEPATPAPKDTARDRRADARVRTAHDHKPPHDVRLTRAATEPADVHSDALDDAACLQRREPRTEAPAIPIEGGAAQTPEGAGDRTLAPTPDALPLPVSMHGTEPPPAASAVASAASAPALSGERDTGVRFSARVGTREQRLPTRGDVNATAVHDNGAAQPPSPEIALPQGKDTAFDLALRGAAAGRSTGAPLFERAPAESTTPLAQATAFAREISHPISTHSDAVAEAALRAAPDEAAFAPALGAQVALWVKDGVQEARLQLHPAELGPIGVQIAIEGRAAHIDFTASVAATRDSIEQSLPALAAALRESGFTLAGGGVFGGRQGNHDSGGGRATAGRGDGARGAAAIGPEGAADVAEPRARRWARSLVDVYA